MLSLPRMQRMSEESDAPEWLDKEVDRHLDDAWKCYLKDQCIEGERLSRAALAMAPFRGDCWYLLGVCLERQRLSAKADRCFQRSATATINPQQAPYRVSWKRFERAVERAADAIPNFLRRALKKLPWCCATTRPPKSSIRKKRRKPCRFTWPHPRPSRSKQCNVLTRAGYPPLPTAARTFEFFEQGIRYPRF